MANGKSTWKYNKLLTARRNYFANAGQMETQNTDVKPNAFSKFMNNVAGNPNEKGTLTTGAFQGMTSLGQDMMKAGGAAIGTLGSSLISNGYSSTGGNVLSGLSSVAGAIPGPWGAVAQAGLGVMGGLWNRAFGAKFNEENIANVENNISRMNNFTSNASDFDSLANNYASAVGGINFNTKYIGSNGWFNSKATDKANELKEQQDAALAFQDRTLQNNADNIQMDNINNLQANFTAFGGPINTGSTHGADFTNGLTSINNGGSHEENPYEGVPMGVDPEGTPNLVEEGETIFNDYVFSKRLTVPKAIRNKYKLRGPITFADASKKLNKESEERPNDPISQRGLEALMSDLAMAQEELKAKKEAKEAQEAMYAFGGRINAYDGLKSKTQKMKRKKSSISIPNWPTNMLPADTTFIGGLGIPTNIRGTINSTMSDNNSVYNQVFEQTYDNGRKGYSIINDDSEVHYLPTTDLTKYYKTGFDSNGVIEQYDTIPSGISSLFDAPNTKAFGGKVNKFDGESSKSQQMYNMKDFLQALSGYTFSKQKSNVTGKYKIDRNLLMSGNPYMLGFTDINELEESPAYQAFTEAMLANPDMDYIGVLDAGVANGVPKLKGADGKLVSNWQDLYRARRTDKKEGIYHWTPTMIQQAIEAAQTPTSIATASTTEEKNNPRNWVKIFNKEKGTYGDAMLLSEALDKGLLRNHTRVNQDDKWGENGTDTLGYYDPNEDDIPMGKYADWLRYAPTLGYGISALTDAFGLTNKPNYSNADAILEATRNGGTYQPVSFNPLGDYLAYNPFDRDYYLNKMSAEAGATRRAIANNAGGNRASAMAGILAADSNYVGKMGDLARQAEEFNLGQREKVATFNRGTNQYNSEGQLKADMANQQALASLRDFNLRGNIAAAQMREAEKNRIADAKSNNISGLFKSLADIGYDEANRRMRDQYINLVAPEGAAKLFGVRGASKNNNTTTVPATTSTEVVPTIEPFEWTEDTYRTYSKGGKVKRVKKNKKGLTF